MRVEFFIVAGNFDFYFGNGPYSFRMPFSNLKSFWVVYEKFHLSDLTSCFLFFCLPLILGTVFLLFSSLCKDVLAAVLCNFKIHLGNFGMNSVSANSLTLQNPLLQLLYANAFVS